MNTQPTTANTFTIVTEKIYFDGGTTTNQKYWRIYKISPQIINEKSHFDFGYKVSFYEVSTIVIDSHLPYEIGCLKTIRMSALELETL